MSICYSLFGKVYPIDSSANSHPKLYYIINTFLLRLAMHLKQLKLAGFKSFVDPTLVHFPSQLVAVLGPNGCGKSNIIDAVRWVMGESSAKNLRGESMVDVIFNGSSARKPVGQASVELTFDNSLGRLTGPFAAYSELSVKRVVTRDGESSYYLNGSRCRKRDITDIFLGTGAGARGYSIIGQGTISRLIEAKPEELRIHLEEAAGVSKYKERRRETLQRIQHTQENLNRVADIREELEKQVQRLERQAKAAERYTQLKTEETVCRAEISALKWRGFQEQQQLKHQAIDELFLHHEKQQSVLLHAQTQKVILNERINELTHLMQETQAKLYQLGTELVRIEESIEQSRKEQRRLEQEKQQLQQDWQQAQEQIKRDQEQNELSLYQVQELDQQWQNLELEHHHNNEQLNALHLQLASLQAQWQEAQSQYNTFSHELDIARVTLTHKKQNYAHLLARQEQVNQDKSEYGFAILEEAATALEAEIEKIKQQYDAAELLEQQNTMQCQQLQEMVQQQVQCLEQLNNQYHQLNTEYAALSAVQQAALPKTLAKIPASVSANARLFTLLDVDPLWQQACERVLQDDLQAYVVDDLSMVVQEGITDVNALTLKARTPQLASRPRLSDKIKGSIPVTAQLLDYVYTAQNLNEALEWVTDLLPYESIVTPQGLWMGSGWVKGISGTTCEEPGLLARQQQIESLSLQLVQVQQEKQMLQAQLNEQREQLTDALLAREDSQRQSKQWREALLQAKTALDKQREKITYYHQRQSELTKQEQELMQAIEDQQLQINQALLSIEQLQVKAEAGQVRHEQLHKAYQEAHQKFVQQQSTVDDIKKAMQRVQAERDRHQITSQQLTERMARELERLALLEARLEQVALLGLQATEPEQAMQERRDWHITQHAQTEQQVTRYQEEATTVRQEWDVLDKAVLHYEQDCKSMQEQISQLRLQEQELAVRAQAIEEQLQEDGYMPQALLAEMAADVSQGMREEALIGLIEKIKRLGPINLAAIDEFASEQERKQYLDEQHADLCEAIATLQTAIDKMDKETKSRLEDTFNAVNDSFKSLFPRLFGGGKAQLELTCDNLLEAGIVVMAQPPGKRNSTIHLLSGGEKAMTAVALIFAIFQLNPSPFCMLDEVDAPLDDVNVGRFCGLVKEMSAFVQFLFITHNKVTMELADHLIGVTMREPGVSRLVAVDVKDALTME